MKRILFPLIAIVSSCADEPDAVPTPAPAPLAVRAAPPPPPLIGVLAAKTSDVVAAQIDGKIMHIDVMSGQHVKAGQLIAEIDAQVLADRLRGAAEAVNGETADLHGAQAEVAEASRQLAMEQRMYDAGAAALEQVRLARASVVRAHAAEEKAEATLREAEAQRVTLEAELQHTKVLAPIDGVVSLVKAQPGEVVIPGAVIAHVFDPSQLMVRFQVTRERRHEIDAGTAVTLRVATSAQPVSAKVRTVSADLEPPLDFAVAEADVIGDAHDMQIGTVGDVSIVK